MKKVSVIVPCYNVEKYLRKCLNSILDQSWENIEIIAVNDGSTDQTLKILSEFVRKDERIKIINKDNGGLSDARNVGISSASGDYILCVDSDDVIESKMIEKMIQLAIKDNLDFVSCDMAFVWEEKNYTKTVKGKRLDTISKKSLLLATPSACNKLIKRELIQQFHFPFGKKFEDLATIPVLLLKAKRVGYVQGAYYQYFQRDGSIIYSGTPNTEDIYFALGRIQEEFNKEKWNQEYKQELEYLFIEHLLLHYCRRMLHHANGDVEIKEAFNYLKKKFPDWKHNIYLSLFTNKERIMLCLLEYSISRKLLVKKFNR